MYLQKNEKRSKRVCLVVEKMFLGKNENFAM